VHLLDEFDHVGTMHIQRHRIIHIRMRTGRQARRMKMGRIYFPAADANENRSVPIFCSGSRADQLAV